MIFKNGATVHRLWGRLPDGELVATFGYMRDAEEFCRNKIESEPKGSMVRLVAIDHCTGAMMAFCVDKEKD